MHDVIQIIPDDHWTASSSSTCASVTVQENDNLLVGPDGTNDLPCSYNEDDESIYIYGLSQDVYLTGSSLKLKLSVSSFTLPNAAYTTSTFDAWAVKIWRWGTNTLLAHYTASTGPVGITAGSVTVSSWAPVGSISASDVVSGMAIYTKVTFTTTHEIPASGTAVITFTNVDITATAYNPDLNGANGSTAYCYLSTYIDGASCSVGSSTVVTITFTKKQAAGSVSIVLLASFSASPKIASVITKTSGSVNIDTTSAQTSWTLSSTNVKMTTFKYFSYNDVIYPVSGTFVSPTTNPGGYVSGSALYLWWVMDPVTAWDATTSVTLSLLFSTSGLAYTQPYIASDASKFAVVIADVTSVTDGDRTVVTATTSTIGSNQVTVTPGVVAAGSTYAMALGHASANKVANPYVASNLATMYETYAKATTSTTIDIASYQYSVAIKSVAATVISTLPLCLNNLSGIPLVVRFKADLVDIDFSSSSYNYAVDVTLTGETALGTGLTHSASEPATVPSKSTASGAVVKLGADGVLTLTGLGSVATSATSFVTTYVAKGVLTSTSFSATSSLYYTLSSDPNTKYYLYQKSGETATLTAVAVAWATAATHSGTLYAGTSGTLTASLDATAQSAVDSIVGVGVPAGFDVASATMTSNSASPSTYYAATSPSKTFTGAFVLGVATANFAVTTTASNFVVANVVPPASASATAATAFTANWFASSATPGSACTHAESVTTGATLQPGALAAPTWSPTSATARGADNVMTTVTLTFITVNAIPGNTGFIGAALDSNWGWPSTCTTTLSDYDENTAVSCSVTTNTLSITGFAAVGAATSITVTWYPVLTPVAAADDYEFASSVYTKISSGGNYIDQATAADLLNICDVSANTGTTGSTSSIAVQLFPNQAGLAGVDVDLTFSLSKGVPVGGTLTITANFASWSWSAGSIKDYCWSNIDYTSCTLSSSAVVLTLSDDLAAGTSVQLYLNKALTLPSTAGVTSTGVIITAAYGGVTISTDVSPGKTVTIGAAVTAAIAVSDITADVENAGEIAAYTFTFTSAAAVESGDYFVVNFPRSFDPYLGHAQNYLTNCEPDTFYIGCDSNTLGSIACTADHWYLLIDAPSKTATANTELDFTVYGIMNPAAGTSSNLMMYHFDSDGVVKAYDESIGTITTTAVSANGITIKSVEVVDAELGATSDYTFDFYAAGTWDSDNTFYFTFPDEFHLGLNLGSTTSCSSVYYDESNAAGTDHEDDQSWATITSCTVADSWIALSVPSSTTHGTWASTDLISVTLKSIPNPQWGLKRAETDNHDTEDPDSFGGEKHGWTDRFEIMNVDSSSQSCVGKSYGVLNGAYLGFTQSYDPIDVNEFDPETDNSRIVLLPGTQSEDIWVSVGDWPLRSKSLVLTPTTNSNYPDGGDLSYTSVFEDWTVWQLDGGLNFRVAAASSIAKGLYYINWSTEEVLQEGVDSSLYNSPLSILVEVCENSSESVAITVATIPTLYKGYTSIPIKVSLENAPASGVTVTFAFGATTTGISTNPSSLDFEPDVDELYFEVVVDSSYDSTQASPVLSFTLSGDDSDVYAAITSRTITVSSTSSSASAVTPTLGTPSIRDGTTASITVTSTQNGVLYWYLTCAGTEVPSFASLKAMTADLVDPVNGTLTLEETLAAEYAATETDMDESKDADMAAFFRRKMQEHCDSEWTSAQPVYAAVATTITLDWLLADTNYMFVAYVDNLLEDDTSSLTPAEADFSTSALPDVYTYSVTFDANVAESIGDNIRETLAKAMGINPSWLDGQDYSTSTARMLQDVTSATFTYNIFYDRSKPDYSPDNIISNFDQDMATSELETLTNAGVTYDSAIVSAGTTPSFTVVPTSSSIGDTTATFIATSSQDGLICVSCAETSVTATFYAWQVLVGLDGASYATPSSCAESVAATSTTLTVTGLSEGTAYNCYFTACNDYPLWPMCKDATATTTLDKVSFVTTTPEDDDSAMIISLFAAFFLIFN